MATSSFYKSSGSTPTAQNTIATSVTQAATSATQAATSATQANTSATNAQNSLNSFQTYYLGTYTTPPSTSQVGALYFNSSTGQLFVWDGTSWNVTTTANNINTTDDLTEGSTNLYFTSERVDDRVNGLLTAGSNITLSYDDAANTLTIASTGGLTDLSASTTNDLNEGSSNLYFTNARATSAITGSDLDMAGNRVLFANLYSAESDLPSASTYHGMFAHVHATGKGYFAHGGAWRKLLDETSSTTSNLTEGSNLYYTDERVDDRVNALLTAGSNITLTYDDAANTLTIASTASGGGGGGGSTTFTGLTDTPSSMGTSGQYLAVNSGGTALEFVAAPSGGSGGSSTFTGLSDTPSSFTASKFVAVNSGGTALEYVNALTPTGLTVTNNAASGGGSLSYIPSGSANSATLSFIPPDLSGYLTGIAGESLYSLSNVYTSSSPSDGQVLTWDNANSYWKPTTVSAGSGGIALTDLSASNATASGGGSLAYNNSTGAFTFTPPDLSGYATTSSLSSYATTASLATVATSGAYGDLTGTPNLSSYLTGITGESLYSLSNVNTSASPTDGQVLTWSNANSYWTPTTVSSGTTINYIASTSTSAAATNNKPKSLAIGSGAEVGTNAQSFGTAIAIGDNAKIGNAQYGGWAIMIGADQEAGYQSVMISPHAGANSLAPQGTCTIIGDAYEVTGSSRSGITLLGAATKGTNYATALGYHADAQHVRSVALGFDATTTAIGQLMLGAPNTGDGFTSIRVGNPSYTPSNAMDLTTKDYVDTAVAGGGGSAPAWLAASDTGSASATATTSLAIGDGSVASALRSLAVGYGADSTAQYTSSFGHFAEALAESSTALGYDTNVSSTHSNSIALGRGATTSAARQLMLGIANTSTGLTSIRVGNTSYTPTNNMDLATKAYVDANAGGSLPSNIAVYGTGTASATSTGTIAIGDSALVGGNTYGIAIGSSAQALDTGAIAIGQSTSVNGGSYGISIGYSSVSTGLNGPVAIGYLSYAGAYSTAVGNGYSTNAGNRCWSGYTGVSMGYQASGQASYATAIGGFSGVTSAGLSGTAVGYGSAVAGSNGTALGNGALAYANQFVLGNSSINDLRCQDTSITGISDSRDKTNVTSLTLGLDFVNAIEPKAFNKNNRGEYYTAQYTDHELNEDDSLTQSYTFDQTSYDAGTEKFSKREFGFIAQDVAAQLPAEYSDARLTYSETEDKYGFDVQRFTMGDMTPILWKALRELSDKHDQLQSDYDALLARVVALENA